VQEMPCQGVVCDASTLCFSYFLTGKVQIIVMSMSVVCWFVFLLVYLRNHTAEFTNCFEGRGSVLLWRRRSTLCTSGFVDDVTLSRSCLMFFVMYFWAAIGHDKHNSRYSNQILFIDVKDEHK